MIILAVSTSGDLCSLAISDDDGVIVERVFRHRMHLSERMIGDVEEILRDAGITLEEIGSIAVDVGPGSFTGVRVGVTAVKVWADALARPVVGVSALECAAYPHFGQFATAVMPMIRARPGAVYTSMFEGASGAHLRSPELLEVEAVAELIKESQLPRLTICGDGWEPYRELIEQSALTVNCAVAFGPVRALSAGILGKIARERMAAGAKTNNPIELVPLYVAPPPIGPAAKSATQSAT